MPLKERLSKLSELERDLTLKEEKHQEEENLQENPRLEERTALKELENTNLEDA